MRFYLSILLLLTTSSLHAQLWEVLKSAEVDDMFSKTQQARDVLVKPNIAITFRVNSGEHSPWQIHADADEFWFVRRGAAKLSLGEFTGASRVEPPGKPFDIAAGDVVSVPRDKAYQIAPGAGRFEYVAVRVFPTARHRQPGAPAPTPRPMPTVAPRAKIEETIANADQNVTLHSVGPVLINHVIYDRVPGPWEVHLACDDLYFWRVGTGRAQIDGTLVNAKEDDPGEPRGFGVTGARDYTVGPGDILFIPRNTAHHMDAGNVKLGYLLVKLCD